MDVEYEGARVLLKRRKAPVYLLHGDASAEFLIGEVAAQLVDYLLPGELRESGLLRFDAGDGVDLDTVLDAAAPSLFATAQVVLVDNAQALTLQRRPKEDAKTDEEKFTNFAQVSRLQRFAASPPADVHIVFLAYEDMTPAGKGAAAGQRSEKILKRAFTTVQKAGDTVRFRRMYTEGCITWLARRMTEAALKPDRGVAEVFVDRAGEDLRHLAMEVDKLAAHLGAGGRVTPAEVRRMVTSCLDNFVSDLLHAMVMRKGQEAVDFLESTLRGSSHPVFIVASVASQMRLLWQARRLLDEGYYRSLPKEYRLGGAAFMAAEAKKVAPGIAASLACEKSRSILGIHSFRAYRIFQEAQRLTLADIEAAMRQLLDIDSRLKGILYPKRGTDEMLLEWLVVDTVARGKG